MGAITLDGREWSTNVTWIPAAITTVVCGGLVIAAADWLNVEGFPIHLLHEPTAVGGGYTPHAPPIEAEGYGGETVPGMHIVFMDNDLSPEEQAWVREQVEHKGFTNGLEGQQVGILTVPSAELSRLLNILNSGASTKEILQGTSGQLHDDFKQAIDNYTAGRNIIITDRQTSFAIKFLPGRGMFIQPGSLVN